jgi:HD-like signal output (HDOD) protein
MFSREELLQEAAGLDPLPAASAEIAKILSNEDWSLDELAKPAMLDPALTGRLLQHANSASSGAAQEITSVKQAMMRLGPSMVMSIALGHGLEGRMSAVLEAYDLEEGELWEHSVAAALSVEVLHRAGVKTPPGTFIAALIHDIGKLVIARKLKSAGIRIARGEGDEAWVEDEADQLGIDHAELGGCIARAWELPGGIPEAVENHHRAHALEPGPTRTMAYVVAAADAIADSVEAGRFVWSPRTQAQLGLTPEHQEKVFEATEKLLDRVLDRAA